MEKTEFPVQSPEVSPYTKDLQIIKRWNEKDSNWVLTPNSIQKSTDTKDELIYQARRFPEKTGQVIKDMVMCDEFFNSLSHLEQPKNEIFWTDPELSLKVVREVIIGIGKPALPILEGINNPSAKYLASTLRTELKNKQFQEMIKKAVRSIKAKIS